MDNRTGSFNREVTVVQNYLLVGWRKYFGIVAAVISYKLNAGFWWAVLHFLIAPWYLAYLAVFRWQDVLHIWAR